MKKKILVVEDEPAIAMALRDELEFEGFDVTVAEDGNRALETMLAARPDLVVLDLMLPGRNGFEVCREARRSGFDAPIIMLTARAEGVDKIRGLDIGADDYVTKPFQLAELVARIRAVLRRSEKCAAEPAAARVFQIGPLRVDVRKREVARGREKIELTRKEFQLLELLLARPGEVITRDEFLDSIWGEDVYVTHRTVDTHVATLRKKLEEDPNHPRYILSVRGIGYKLNENPAGS
jgi:DNA-binding response OmpR family regulator